MLEFFNAALPWVICAVTLAFIFAFSGNDKNKDNKEKKIEK